MSDPCKGEGATHYACPCTLERMTKLEQVAKAAKDRLEIWTTDTYSALKEALKAVGL